MKVVLIGPGEVDGRSGVVWDAVRDVLRVMGPQDELVHTGGDGVGAKVESIVRRAKGVERRRLPRVDVQLPEIGRYPRERAYELNAAQLLQVHAPHAVVYVGEGLDAETAAVLELARRKGGDGVALFPRVEVYDAEAFARERGTR